MKLSEISSKIVYGVSESAKAEGSYKLLRITDIQDNKVNWSTVPLTDFPEDKVGNYLLNVGDILFARTGATVGKSYLVDDSVPDNSIYASYLIKVRISHFINSDYVKLFFESGFYWQQIADSSVGVGQPNVNGTSLGNLWLPIPPFQEQERIVKQLKSWCALINQIKASQESISEKISDLRNHILELAISGKLVPQDPSDEPAINLLKHINSAIEPCDNRHYENVPTGWQFVKIKDVFTINPKNKIDDDIDAGFVSMAMIDDGYRDSYQFEKKKWALIKNGFTHFKDGDIAVAKISPCLENRKSMILKNLPNGIGAGTTELHIFRSAIVDPKFALYFFKSDHFINQCVGTFNGVVGQQRVGKNIIEDIMFPLPPYKEQRRISERITQIFMYLDKITAEL